MRQKKTIDRKPAVKPATKKKPTAVPAAKGRAAAKAAVEAKPAAAAKPASAPVAPKKASASVPARRSSKAKPAAPALSRVVDPEAPPIAANRPAKKLAARSRPRTIREAKFAVGQVVRHRVYPFRGVVFDIDPVFANTEEWLAAIPAEVRPRRNQPFYHLLAESAETEYIAYVSEQNLLADDTGQPLRHPQINEYFVEEDDGTLRAVFLQAH